MAPACVVTRGAWHATWTALRHSSPVQVTYATTRPLALSRASVPASSRVRPGACDPAVLNQAGGGLTPALRGRAEVL